MSVFNRVLILLFVASLCGCGSDSEYDEQATKEQKELNQYTEKAYNAVPADAVAIADFERFEDLNHIVNDTTNFAYGIVDSKSPLIEFQKVLLQFLTSSRDIHSLYVLVYSSKNEVSLLQIMDFQRDSSLFSSVVSRLDSLSVRSKTYNGVPFVTLPTGLNVAYYDNMLLASSSAISIENSIRHLNSSSSILSNGEFYDVLSKTGGVGYLYINHKQIGKLFSGVVTRPYLRYADFTLRYATWSALQIGSRQRNFISFSGESFNNNDAANYSTLFSNQKPSESFADQILPASTIFAISIHTESIKSYLNNYRLYLDANKKINSYNSRIENLGGGSKKKIDEWLIDEGYNEIIAALCLIGGKYEWITFTYKKTHSILRFFTGIKNKIEKPVIKPYQYQGYISALLGEIFSYCNEESICSWGEWCAIGSQKAIQELAFGKASNINLKRYLSHTPVSSFFSDKYIARVIVNVGEGADTVQNVLQKYYRGQLLQSLKHKNFEYATIGITRDKKMVITSLDYYAVNLSSPPRMFVAGDEQEGFFIDSTIKKDFGPFMLIDPQDGDTLYFGQSPKYLSISLANSKKRALWGIPIKDTISNCAGIVTLKDGRSYIAYITSDKLCMISRKGAYAYGYPKQLKKSVAVGPVVIQEDGEYRLLVLYQDNTIDKLDLQGERVADWKEIHAAEFTHNLPEIQTLFGKQYYILRTISKTRIYNTDGSEITSKNWKKPIHKESVIQEYEDGYIKVMGLDSKEFLFNLSNGRIKKL